MTEFERARICIVLVYLDRQSQEFRWVRRPLCSRIVVCLAHRDFSDHGSGSSNGESGECHDRGSGPGDDDEAGSDGERGDTEASPFPFHPLPRSPWTPGQLRGPWAFHPLGQGWGGPFLGGSSLLRGWEPGHSLAGPLASLPPSPRQSGFACGYPNFSQHIGLARKRFAPLPTLAPRTNLLRGVGFGGPPVGLSELSSLRGNGAGQRRFRFSADLIMGPTATPSTVTGKRKRAAPVTTASPPRAVRFSKRIRGNKLAVSAAAAGPSAATARQVVRPNLRASRRIVN